MSAEGFLGDLIYGYRTIVDALGNIAEKRRKLKIVGDAATVTDDEANDTTIVTINNSAAAGGTNGLMQYADGTIINGAIGLTWDKAASRLTVGSGAFIAFETGTVPAAGFMRLPYAAGVKVILARKDSGGTDRNWLAFTADTSVLGNAQTSLSMLANAFTLTGLANSWIALGAAPAAAGTFRVPSVVAQIIVAGTKTLLAASSTDGYLFTDSSFTNQVGGYGRIFAGTGLVLGVGSTGWMSIDSGGFCLAINGQNWAFGTNVGGYGGGACVGHWHAATTNPTTNPTAGVVMYVDSGDFYPKFRMPSGNVAIVDVPNPGICGLRLTLRTGEPIPTQDTATSTSLFFSPLEHGGIMLYDATSGHWHLRVTSEVTLAVGTVVSGKLYDVWATWSGSAVVLSFSNAWTNDTTRADARARQDGIQVKSGTPALRYVGTVRAISTTQLTDTQSQRFVYNAHNKVERWMYVEDTTANWAYALAAYRQVRATTTNKVEIVCGDPIPLHAEAHIVQGSATTLPGTGIGIDPGVGLDSTTTPFTKSTGMLCQNAAVAQWDPAECEGDTVMAAGYHAVNWLEACSGASSINAFGLVGHFQSNMRARATM